MALLLHDLHMNGVGAAWATQEDDGTAICNNLQGHTQEKRKFCWEEEEGEGGGEG